jgi:hypothetical protein
MTKEEYMKKHDEIRNAIVEKYGDFMYFMIVGLFDIIELEKICEEQGWITKRKNFTDSYQIYSVIYDGDTVIGHIESIGFPSIEFCKKKRKYAEKIKNNPIFIKPIIGLHRVLDWHTVRGKFHCLAGGQTILHSIPIEISDDKIQDFIIRKNLGDLVEKTKKMNFKNTFKDGDII